VLNVLVSHQEFLQLIFFVQLLKRVAKVLVDAPAVKITRLHDRSCFGSSGKCAAQWDGVSKKPAVYKWPFFLEETANKVAVILLLAHYPC